MIAMIVFVLAIGRRGRGVLLLEHASFLLGGGDDDAA
jgi:hypothetical protein